MRFKISLFGLVILAGFAAVLAAAAFAQGDAVEVGVPTANRNAFELIGQIDQVLFNTTVYGHVTYIDGIDTALLFAPDTQSLNRSAAAALVTFTGTGVATSRSIHENIFFQRCQRLADVLLQRDSHRCNL